MGCVMMKTKTKILIMLSMVVMLIMLFAISCFALEINLTFYNGSSIDESFGEKGKLEIQAGVPYTLPTKEVEAGYSFNWYTSDGRAWVGGTEVILYEDTKLYQLKAIDVSDFQTFQTEFRKDQSIGIRLLNDISGNQTLGLDWYATPLVLLNGHTLKISGDTQAFMSGQRAGPYFYGIGKVIFETTHKNPLFGNMSLHGYRGDECNLFVGRDVELYAPNAVLWRNSNNDYFNQYPYIMIHGKVTCKIAYATGSKTNTGARVEVNEGGILIIKDRLLNMEQEGNSTRVNIKGGTVIMDNSTYSFFRDEKAIYNLTGGNILFAYDTDPLKINEVLSSVDNPNYKAIDFTVNGKTYKTIVPIKCGLDENGDNREHSFIQKTKIEASCGNLPEEIYLCEHCSHEISFRYGEHGEHEYEFSEKKVATKTELGWEKYICNTCNSVEYRVLLYDPSTDTISVTIINGSGQKETVEAAIKELFALTETSTGYSITDIRAFGEYGVDSIDTIIIPMGVVSVNFGTNRANVKEVVIDDGAIVTIESLTKLTSLETITVKKATVTFNAKCAPSTLKTINANVEGANINFKKEAFTGITSITELNMVAGSTYTFGQDSFKKTNIKKLVFPNGANATFAEVAAFYQAGVEELYIGTGTTKIANSTFYGNSKLHTIVLMEINSIGDSAFESIAQNAKVYHHAETLTIGNNGFKKNTNLSLYTIAKTENGSAFNECTNYVIHYGIKHAYTIKTVDASCTTEGGTYYETDCPCGQVKDAIYKLFKGNVTNSTTYDVVEVVKVITPKSAHGLNVLVDIRYDNGYAKFGTGVFECDFCHNNIDESIPTQRPLIACLGFSTQQVPGSYGMATRYEIDRDAINNFIGAKGGNFEIGMVLALKDRLGSLKPLKDDGSAQAGARKINLTSTDSVYYELKLTGIQEAMLESSYVMCFYIMNGSDISYVQDNETIKNPSGISYNELYDITHMDYIVPTSKEN